MRVNNKVGKARDLEYSGCPTVATCYLGPEIEGGQGSAFLWLSACFIQVLEGFKLKVQAGENARMFK